MKKSGKSGAAEGATRVLTLGLLLLAVLATDARANIFGADKRRPLRAAKYPWSTIGRLNLPDGSICTATLVSQDLILTSSHCVIDELTGLRLEGKFVFQAALTEGRAAASSEATPLLWGTTDPLRKRDLDWAILRLREPLGRTQGWMDLNSVELGQLKGQALLNHAAYSWDFLNAATASVQVGCAIQGSTLGFLLHDCDSSSGASGSPLFLVTPDGRAHLVAIHAAERRGDSHLSRRGIEYSDGLANLAVSTNALIAPVNSRGSRLR